MKDRWSYLFATCFGIGLAKVAPGTLGALPALVLHWAFGFLPVPLHLAIVCVITVIAVYTSGEVCRSCELEDPQNIVIDELVGALFALFLVSGFGFAAEIIAVILFRILDIAKPWPIYFVAKWKPAGVGVVADDIVAGVIAGLVTFLLWSL